MTGEEVIVEIEREDDVDVVELTELEARASALFHASARQTIDVQPTREEQLDELETALMGCESS